MGFFVTAGPLLLMMLALFLIWQVALPAFTGKPFFWIVRKSAKKRRQAECKLSDAEINLEARKARRQTTKLNKK